MKNDAILFEQHNTWIEGRSNFIQALATPGSTASQEKWQRNYFHGQYFDGQQGSDNHQIKLCPKPFSIGK